MKCLLELSISSIFSIEKRAHVLTYRETFHSISFLKLILASAAAEKFKKSIYFFFLQAVKNAINLEILMYLPAFGQNYNQHMYIIATIHMRYVHLTNTSWQSAIWQSYHIHCHLLSVWAGWYHLFNMFDNFLIDCE